MSNQDILKTAQALRWDVGDDLHDNLISGLYADAGKIAEKVVSESGEKKRFSWELTLDKILTGKLTAFPIMFFILSTVFWITIEGANYPSGMLATLLIDNFHPVLKSLFVALNSPEWISGLMVNMWLKT